MRELNLERLWTDAEKKLKGRHLIIHVNDLIDFRLSL